MKVLDCLNTDGLTCMNVLNTQEETPCPKGTFCKQVAGISACPAGFYCPRDLDTQNLCEAGRYCPSPSSKKLCPPGSYCVIGETIPCDAGSFKMNLIINSNLIKDDGPKRHNRHKSNLFPGDIFHF